MQIKPNMGVVAKSRIDCEIDLIYSLYRKSIEMQNASLQARNTHDFDKWKKKFVLVFNREKLLDLAANPAIPFDFKNLTLKPIPLNKQGEKILKSNAKFWIIFCKLAEEKINNNNRTDLK